MSTCSSITPPSLGLQGPFTQAIRLCPRQLRQQPTIITCRLLGFASGHLCLRLQIPRDADYLTITHALHAAGRGKTAHCLVPLYPACPGNMSFVLCSSSYTRRTLPVLSLAMSTPPMSAPLRTWQEYCWLCAAYGCCLCQGRSHRLCPSYWRDKKTDYIWLREASAEDVHTLDLLNLHYDITCHAVHKACPFRRNHRKCFKLANIHCGRRTRGGCHARDQHPMELQCACTRKLFSPVPRRPCQ